MVAFVCFVVFVVSACLLTLDAMKNGVGKKRWFFTGLIVGPLAWPMLNMKKQMTLRRQSGFNIASFRA